MTKLGNAIAAAPAKASAVSRLMAALAGKRVLKPLVVPLPGGGELAAVMTLVGAQRLLDIEGEVARAMEARGLANTIETRHRYELERALRTIADAVLESDANPTPVGSTSEWGQLAPEVIGHLWAEYSELSEEHDPAGETLSSLEMLELKDALAKKNRTALVSFGARKLSDYLLFTADPPPDSPTPRSSPGDSSPAS